jgi:hypothetical protein
MSKQKGKYDVELIKRQNAALRKYAAIQKAAEETIGCQKIYIDIAGGVPEAFVLDELIFFTLPRPETGKSGLRVWKEGVLWMAVSRAEWWERKRLTPKEADGAIERLLKRDLIFKDHFLFNKQKTTHLRLNVTEFFKRYTEELEKQNPPEDEGDTMLKDIQDLYEMLGIPVKDTPHEGIPDGVEGIPVKEEVSLNGDSINIPHASSTQPPLEEEEINQANAMVDAIIANAKKVKYENRDKFPETLIPYADTYVELTGQKPSKRVLFDWLSTFSDWIGEGLQPQDIADAYKHATRPNGGFLVGRPGSLTNTAVALKTRRNNGSQSEVVRLL